MLFILLEYFVFHLQDSRLNRYNSNEVHFFLFKIDIEIGSNISGAEILSTNQEEVRKRL